MELPASRGPEAPRAPARLPAGAPVPLRERWRDLLGALQALVRPAAARRRQALRRLLADRSQFPVCLLDARKRVLWVNRAFAKLAGRALDDCRGQALETLLGLQGGDPAPWVALAAQIDSPQDGRLLVPVCGGDGQRRWLLGEVLHLPPRPGGQAHVVVQWVDQTEAQDAQQRLQGVLLELQHERERLGHILAGTQVGAWEINLVTGTARMDDAWAALFGYRREELEPWSRVKAREMLHPDDRAATDLQVQGHLAGRLPGVDIEQRVRHRSGEWVWVHSRGKVATRLADGTPEWLSGSHMDIRARKQQQAALEAQRAHTRSVLASLPGVVFEFERDERGALHFHFLSDAMLGMFGLDPETARREPELLLAHTPEEDRLALHAAMAQSAARMSLLEHEYRVQQPGRAPRWLGLHAQPAHNAEGQVVWRGMLLDVTRRHELGQQLAQAREQAEGASRAKSAFLATMSHEIRSPMNGVLGMTDVLMSATTPADRDDAVQTIRESARALLGLIDDILDFSKVEAGQLRLERLALDPAQLFEAIAEAQASSSAAAQVRLRLQLDPDLPGLVWGDPTRLRQVLVNLVSNAIKFSRRGATGTVPGEAVGTQANSTPGASTAADPVGEVQLTLLRAEPPRQGLRFRVEDQGIGMDEATLAGLFQPFMQADASTTRRFGGTGLGLAIVRRLVDAMGGELQVRSRPGEGSCFEVWLPLPPADEPPATAPPALAGLRCVVLGPAAATHCIAAALASAGAAVQQREGLGELLADQAELASWPGHPLARRAVVLMPSWATVDELQARVPALSALRQALQVDLRFLLLAGQGRPQPLQIIAPEVGVLRTLRRPTLHRAVATLAGAASPEVQAPLPPWVGQAGRPDREQARAAGRLVLVVEDDATNRKVAQRQLELLGLAADVAGDGEQGLERWRTGDYALVLTDLHMPRCDGYTLARSLRAEEAATGRPRTPLLALTANALSGEEYRAREAGIDDYLTKPITLEALHAALQRWLSGLSGLNTTTAALAPAAAPAPPPAAADGDARAWPVLELQVLRRLVGDEDEVVADFLDEFRRALDQALPALRLALAEADSPALVAIGHRLKSSCRAVGALALGHACEALERTHAGADAAGQAALGWRFERALGELQQALAQAPRKTGAQR